ncbi:hypothetical protein [Myxosarcina sp. GI1]|uniref:hypothetical protein n=1 Tax=Myxosarcina sp. GI1 TaxID=1541065 RepID=UPI00155A4E30|nr:hypothetical protein [Myxosarcina sp. GI1]
MILLTPIFLSFCKLVRAEKLQLVTEAYSIYELITTGNTLYFVQAKINKNQDLSQEWMQLIKGHRSKVWKYHNNKLTEVTRIETNNQNLGLDPKNLIIHKNTLYFTGESNEHGRELWSYNKRGLQIIDVVPGKKGSAPSNLIVYNGELYFTVSRTFFKYDGFSVARLDSMPNIFFYFWFSSCFSKQNFFWC